MFAISHRDVLLIGQSGNITVNADIQPQANDWQAIILSSMVPVAIATTFLYIACLPDWTPSQVWIVGMAALVPLELLRTFVQSMLGDSYKTSNGPVQALKSFLFSVGILLSMFIVWMLVQGGFSGTIELLTHPIFIQALGIPIIIIVVDGALGILAFRGDPKFQASKLEAISSDTIDVLGLFVARFPLVILPVYGLLAWGKNAGLGLLFWVPDATLDLLRSAGLVYAAAYFVCKAVIVANVFTARFAQTGKRLLDIRWIQRNLYPSQHKS